MNKKICQCPEENPWYEHFIWGVGTIKCQNCMGEITDKARLKKIKDYNTPVEVK